MANEVYPPFSDSVPLRFLYCIYRQLYLRLTHQVSCPYSPRCREEPFSEARLTLRAKVVRHLPKPADDLTPFSGSPSFSVQHGWTAASLVSYNAGHVLIEEALHVAVAQSTRPPTRERRHLR